MKRYFEIEWADDLGEMWMNEGNLLTCLNTKEHCGEELILNVQDITTNVILLQSQISCKDEEEQMFTEK